MMEDESTPDDWEKYHCDVLYDSGTLPECVMTFLDFARAPATFQMRNGPQPDLFADYKDRRVKITMASRFGDVGIAFDHATVMGYDQRLLLNQLTNFGKEP